MASELTLNVNSTAVLRLLPLRPSRDGSG
jgi:hypothetical protein